MNDTRVKKYDSDKKPKARTEKNKDLYKKEEYSNVEYVDIDNAISMDKIDKENLKRSAYQAIKDFDLTEKKEKATDEVKVQEKRTYDINEILEEAKAKDDKKDNKKRTLNTEYNILTKLDIDKINSSKDLSKENLKDLINSIYEKEGENNPKPKKEKKEKELFEDLMATNYSIDEEISKTILEKEEKKEKTKEVISKKDIAETKEVVKEDKKEDYSSKELKELIKKDDETDEFKDLYETHSKGKIITIVILVLAIIAVGIYLFLKYYGTI